MKLPEISSIFKNIFYLITLSLCLLGINASYGQSALGSIYGDVKSGSKVTVINEDTGLTREASSDSNGRFNVGSLPPGNYTVSATKPDGSPSKQVVRVNPGVGTALSLAGVISLEEVVVMGSRFTQIDTTTSQVSTTYNAEQLAILPVAQDVVNVALLAPGTVKGDSEFGNLASFGGSSVAENSYYINGFNVTNLFQNLAYSSVPFYGIESEQVLTGGYGPEYGLSTGGVINIVTKKGSNQWESGIAMHWQPNELRATNPATYTSDGQPFREYSKNHTTSQRYDAWVGGPVVQDKLFVYAIGEFGRDDYLSHPRTFEVGSNVIDRTVSMPYGLINLDWNINSNHSVSLTAFNDSTKQETAQYEADTSSGWATQGNFLGTDHYNTGGTTIIGRYNGTLTDNLSLSAQYGTLTSNRENYQVSPNGTLISYNGKINDFNQPGCPYILYQSSYTGATQPSCYVSSIIGTRNGKDERKAGRVDLSYKLNTAGLGSHLLKTGYETDDWSTFSGESYAGGTYYRYGTYASQQAVRVRHFQTGADAGVETKAFYLKDDWQVTDQLLVQLGLRNDSFKNLNGDGVAYLKQDNILQPRVGFSLDINGDSSSKLYGSFGIYSLPVAGTVAVRGASASIYSSQYFSYTGIDSVTGIPYDIDPATGKHINVSNNLSDLVYLNHEDGTTPNPKSVSSQNLDPTIQNEFILGYQFQATPEWTLGARMTYRDLQKTIDDMCDSRPFEAWALSNSLVWDDTNLPGCFMINPGSPVVVDADVTGDGVLEHITLSPTDVGLPKAVRRNISVELTAEKIFSNNWSTQLSYTWSHNYGNAEGLVDSDIGQDDTGVTQAFDAPELMVGSYGNLPNDRRHVFKGTGLYKLNEEVTLSFGTLLQSGRPKICLGTDPVDALEYGVAYYNCGGNVVPRGSTGTTPWMFNADLGITYEPKSAPGLSLQAKVFNVLNSHKATNLRPYGEYDDATPDPSYNTPVSYQTPRYVQLSAVYKFGAKK